MSFQKNRPFCDGSFRPANTEVAKVRAASLASWAPTTWSSAASKLAALALHRTPNVMQHAPASPPGALGMHKAVPTGLPVRGGCCSLDRMFRRLTHGVWTATLAKIFMTVQAANTFCDYQHTLELPVHQSSIQ